jgi:hypothetical protein
MAINISERERIEKDLIMFDKNMQEVEKNDVTKMAYRYYVDAGYYLKKGDYFTAFGCINYAHGLLDAIRKEFK